MVEGKYAVVDQVVKFVEGPDRSWKQIAEFERLLSDLAQGRLTAPQAIAAATNLDASFGALLREYIQLGMSAVALLLTVFQLYLENDAGKKDEDFRERLIEAVETQSETTAKLTTQLRHAAEQNFREYDKKVSSNPAKAKARPDAGPIKPKSKRRLDVKKDRKRALQHQRSSLGGARRR